MILSGYEQQVAVVGLKSTGVYREVRRRSRGRGIPASMLREQGTAQDGAERATTPARADVCREDGRVRGCGIGLAWLPLRGARR